MKRIVFIGGVMAALLVGTTGCGISSKDAYQKSKLSGFVADQTKLLIDENNMKLDKGDGGIGKAVEETKVKVYASADKTGSETANAKLRERRANAVKNFMSNSLGVPAEKIQIVTAQPAYTGTNNLDRRVVVGVVVK